MIYVLVFLIWVLLAGCGIALVAGGAERTACSGDCAQGRNCTCRKEVPRA